MNNAITYNTGLHKQQKSGFYITDLQEWWPGGNNDQYTVFGSYVEKRIPRRVMAKILSHVSRENVYPFCKFIPVTINQM